MCTPGDVNGGVAQVGGEIGAVVLQCRIDDGEFLIGQDLGAEMIAHGAKDGGEIIGTGRSAIVASRSGDAPFLTSQGNSGWSGVTRPVSRS